MTVFGFLYLGLGLIDNDNANDHEGASMTEEWRPVSGYEGLYEVSSFGRVRSLNRVVKDRRCGTKNINGRILKPNHSLGYAFVNLHRGNGNEGYHVHRLVAEAFLPRQDGKDQVNHKNLNKADNMLANLEWVTPSENTQHAVANGAYDASRKSENRLASKNVNVSRKLTKEDVGKIRELLAKGVRQTEIATSYGVRQSMISSIKCGISWRDDYNDGSNR